MEWTGTRNGRPRARPGRARLEGRLAACPRSEGAHCHSVAQTAVMDASVCSNAETDHGPYGLRTDTFFGFSALSSVPVRLLIFTTSSSMDALLIILYLLAL